jgi:DNA mismatch endonuclease (patch repair protein)
MNFKQKDKNNPMYGKHHSEETKRKIGLTNKNRIGYWKGKKLSEETKEKIRLARIGTKHTEKTKLKMSQKRKGKNHPLYGKHHSKESLLKMRLAHKGQKSYWIDKKRPPFSEEWKNKMSLSHIGKYHLEETKNKISNSHKRKNRSNEHIQNIKKYHNLPEIKERHRQFMIKRRPFIKIPFKDSSIEIIMQKGLREKGIVFETHNPIIKGIPDIFIKPNICVFADGDWYHGYIYQQKQQNLSEYWQNHFKNKIEKDKQVTKQLISEGFIVLRFWEHEIKKNTEECIDTILFYKNMVI